MYTDLGPKMIQTMCGLSVFSLIANVTFPHHTLNKIKHCRVIG